MNIKRDINEDAQKRVNIILINMMFICLAIICVTYLLFEYKTPKSYDFENTENIISTTNFILND